MVAAGGQPPLEIPDDREMDRFAAVWRKIAGLDQTGISADVKLAIIE